MIGTTLHLHLDAVTRRSMLADLSFVSGCHYLCFAGIHTICQHPTICPNGARGLLASADDLPIWKTFSMSKTWWTKQYPFGLAFQIRVAQAKLLFFHYWELQKPFHYNISFESVSSSPTFFRFLPRHIETYANEGGPAPAHPPPPWMPDTTKCVERAWSHDLRIHKRKIASPIQVPGLLLISNHIYDY